MMSYRFATPGEGLGKERSSRKRRLLTAVLFLLVSLWLWSYTPAWAADLSLQHLIDEALRSNPEILALHHRLQAAHKRIPQARALPDPMVMIGYQNEGARYLYTFATTNDMGGSQWMFSASQMFPYPGKLSLKGDMATRETEALKYYLEAVKLKTAARVKELYYDLFFAHKNINLITERSSLFTTMEEAALARYSAGMAPQQEVLMAQTEKYMLLEREEMLRQKIQSLEAMLNAAVGRRFNGPMGRPAEPIPLRFDYSREELLRLAEERSPEIKAKEKMIAVSEAKAKMAKREFYPDFTLTGSYFARRPEYLDMWSVTASVNIPLYSDKKQRPAVEEAMANVSEANSELVATKLMIAAAIRENHTMIRSAERLMELYKDGLIPKTNREIEAALAGYMTGKIEALTVINRLKTLIEVETLYWGQFVEREKAIARLTAITGGDVALTQKSESGRENR